MMYQQKRLIMPTNVYPPGYTVSKINKKVKAKKKERNKKQYCVFFKFDQNSNFPILEIGKNHN